jgi:hypothetical protein
MSAAEFITTCSTLSTALLFFARTNRQQMQWDMQSYEEHVLNSFLLPFAILVCGFMSI